MMRSQPARITNLIRARLEKIRDIAGVYAEFGVFTGEVFVQLVSLASQYGKAVHGFDSFRGLAQPSEWDKSPREKTSSYLEGKFDVGGSAGLVEKLATAGYRREEDYYLWEGYIPEIFRKIPRLGFSFCYIDLDHYLPTKHALEYAWKHLTPGGYVLCDDYCPPYRYYASRAIREFLDKHKPENVSQESWIDYSGKHKQVSFQKMD